MQPTSSSAATATAKHDFTYIVIGLGGLGSGALYWLSTQVPAEEVLGIEQFELGHHNGGSQDHSRIIRLSQDEVFYTVLAPHMYTAWRAVEDESGVQIVYKTGAIVFGDKENSQEVRKYSEAMKHQGIPHVVMTGPEANRRFPQLQLADTDLAVYQADGGLVDARKGNATHIALAKARGVTIKTNTKVISIVPIGTEGVRIVTDKGTFTGKKLIITAGSWTKDLMKNFGLDLPLWVTQEQVTYYQTPHLREFAPDRFPVWISYYGDKCFYGFPVYGEVATKAGLDCGGDVVTATTRSFQPNKVNEQLTTEFLEKYIPRSVGEILYTKTCLYCLTPDRHFIIDHPPGYPQVSFCVDAGHAYKWASLIGLILSQMAITGRTTYPIDAFRVTRPAILHGKAKECKL